MMQIENLYKSFGQRQVFSNLSLTFEPGKVYALIGSSGSGKTTLLNIMGKLESYEGQITYRGKDLKSYRSTDFFRFELAYLFQNYGLIENETIDENLRLGLLARNHRKKERLHLEKQALERVGLSYLDLNQPIFELSGGEAQRVALAKVILKNPPLLLADEPTASIDPVSSKHIMEILLSLREDHRIMIIATHSPTIWEMADQIISLDSL